MLILILSFAVFLVVGVPIAYALGLSSLMYLLIEQPSLAVVVPQRVFSGMNNYALISLPLFILMGQVMNSSGITARLIDLSTVVVGRLRGGLRSVRRKALRSSRWTKGGPKSPRRRVSRSSSRDECKPCGARRKMQNEAHSRTAIFLDIDGVLQSPSSQRRFKHDLDELRRRLADDLDDAAYLDFDKYDLGAIYHDWDKDAVERLRALCEDFGAEIVVSSDWRRGKSVEMLRAYFRIHDLHRHVTDKTGESGGPPHYRAGEVKDYLDAHPGIERFVIVDDGYRKEFDELFPEQFVHTWATMEADDAARARQILSGRRA